MSQQGGTGQFEIWRGRGLRGLLLFILVSCTSPLSFGQMDYGLNQVPYRRGQNVVPVFEGWERNADGSFNMVFGYLNRNYEEEIDVPIGPDNNIEPGGPDQGQPTAFRTRRNQFQFRIRVPKDWGTTNKLVWTLTVRGRTEKANAFLLPEWEMNDQIVAGRFGGSGGAPEVGDNKAPTVVAGASQTIMLPQSAALTVSVSDDGLPKPRVAQRPPVRPPTAGSTAPAGGAAAVPGAGPKGTGSAASGAPAAAPPPPASLLRVEWVAWRKPEGSTVTFSPAASPVIAAKAVAAQSMPSADPKAAAETKPDPVVDGKASTKATFSAPGTYFLKAFAFDGGLSSTSTVFAVKVNAAQADTP